ncbi:hypothetical protein H6G94_22790 [Nostoc punctiforme FACHB-252]|uniref:Isochorismate synthase n=1 Tax=Nostoc punctiforme FACHB-252 TaxID=1357509 RepID=A0ABR8HFW7_NOSPU|nr:hypothetical protein [Nostoc punctiforme]MBD2614065.1 hypothetical protein [Nostoc punctiforme FACHB-252]
MTIYTKIRQFINSIQEFFGKIINYILTAVSRIFAPKDDDYPASGVQPFEGDIADDKRKF